MDKKQMQAAVDYINGNAKLLHGPDLEDNLRARLDIGPEITTDDVIGGKVVGTDVVLVVNRGIKGSPKYHIPAADIEAWAAAQAPPPKTTSTSSRSKKSKK